MQEIVQIFIPFTSIPTAYGSKSILYRFYGNGKWYDMSNITKIGERFNFYTLNYETVTLTSTSRVISDKIITVPPRTILIGTLMFTDFATTTKGHVVFDYNLNNLNYDNIFIDKQDDGQNTFKTQLLHYNTSATEQNIKLYGYYSKHSSSSVSSTTCSGYAQYLEINLLNNII